MKNQNQNKRRGQRREQPRKDNKSKRVNFDNTRDSKFKEDMREAAGMKDCRSNDVVWYAHNAELLKSAASIGWSATTGLPLSGFMDRTAVPGVMSLLWAPVVGAEFNAPLNQAANEVYSFIVHANSRNTSYNSPDVMAVIIAASSLFSAFAMGVRAYGTARLYSQLDYYTPDALLTAQGFSPSDVRRNLANMWFDLNEIAARLTQIWIPNTMPVLERWFWLNSNIYKDGDSAKAQYYLFVPYTFYQFGLVDNSSGCTTVSWGNGTLHTWSNYLDMMDGMINALLNDEDRGVMMGDILKAYGADKLFAVNPISADFMVQPVYDREVLTQIENATMFANEPGNIAQDSAKSNLVQGWAKVTSLNSQITPASTQILNFHQKEDPTPEQIMVATRLKIAGVYVAENTGAPNPSATLAPNTFGTEVVRGVTIHGYTWAAGGKTLTRTGITDLLAQDSTAESITLVQSRLWNAFDWAPWIYSINVPELPTTSYESVSIMPNRAIGDYDNYVVITENDLKKMHRTAVYSEFGVPVL